VTLFKLLDTLENRIAAATTRAGKLPQSILSKAFRGELVPTEAEIAAAEGRDYEPASALLKRISKANDRGRGDKNMAKGGRRQPNKARRPLDASMGSR
jgi:type I restriction enzyme S subunit